MVEEILKDYLKEHNEILYDCELVKEYDQLILRVLIDKEDGINIDELAQVNEYLSEHINDDLVSDSEYMLEVSSPGVEKKLRNLEEIIKAIDEYISVTDNNNTYEGYLISTNEDEIEVKINLKGRMKNIKVKTNEIKEIRLAVKF